MHKVYSSFLVLGIVAGACALPACESSGGDTGGSAGTTMTGGAGGDTGGSMMTTGGSGGSMMTTGGAGGAGGGSSVACPGGPTEEIAGDITADKTLTADTCWLLKGAVLVSAGATLTIEPGTTILGDQASKGILVIKPGAKIVADGTADKPIVFTSQKMPGSRAAGDWGGVVILGNAPTNIPGGKGSVEGLPVGPDTEYGGNKADDDSGVIRYVRIEFSGIQLSADNEINGLTFAGVGNKTVVDQVEVHDTLDDCFEFFGGTVNAKHLVCAFNQDDGFDWDFGYTGKLQFLALAQDPLFEDDTNGIEADNDATGSPNTPVSSPIVYNATFCGKNQMVDGPKKQYGMLLRRSTKGSLYNMVVTGFEWCADLRDPATDPMINNSICHGNIQLNIGEAEEQEWFGQGTGNTEIDPKIKDCFGAKPDFTPEATLSDDAATPPNDGFFDAGAKYKGAFEAGSNWASGAWVSFDRK